MHACSWIDSPRIGWHTYMYTNMCAHVHVHVGTYLPECRGCQKIYRSTYFHHHTSQNSQEEEEEEEEVKFMQQQQQQQQHTVRTHSFG